MAKAISKKDRRLLVCAKCYYSSKMYTKRFLMCNWFVNKKPQRCSTVKECGEFPDDICEG